MIIRPVVSAAVSLLLLFGVVVVVVGAIFADDTRRTYIVHLDESTLVSNSNSNNNILKYQYYRSVLDSIEDEEYFRPELVYSYESTTTGFAAKLTRAQSVALGRVKGVLMVNPDEMLRLHTTYSTHFLGLHPGVGPWSPTNLAADVIIGVLDTGIWPEHVSFSGTGFPAVPSRWKGECEKGTNFSSAACNRKLIGARAFFKGYESINGRINESTAAAAAGTEYRSPRDANGHGTHTASTAAGNAVPGASLFGLASGVASGMRFTSRIAAYKVCYSAGCASSDVLAAIDKAVSDGVDVISLSLGGQPRPYYRDSMAIAALGAVRRGVLVSCSAGNSGPSPSTVGNMAPWMLTVGASYIDRTFPTLVRLGNGMQFIGTSLYRPYKYQYPSITINKNNKKNIIIRSLPLAYNATAAGSGGPRSGAEFCLEGSLSPKLVKGKIVLCDRGLTSRVAKGDAVNKAGGAGMLLLNTPSQGEELIADAHVLPAANLGATASANIKAYLLQNQNVATASLEFQGTVYGSRAPIMAAFSSRGPSIVDPNVIKPDITGPGVNILAAWPPLTSPTELDTDTRRVLFNVVSGTSMSCPHLSGIAALVRSAHRDWSPAAIKSAIMTTAYTHDNRAGPMQDMYSNSTSTISSFATPFAFGSGHVDPTRASDPGLVYDIPTSGDHYLNYLCTTLNYTDPQIALLARKNYTCSSPSSSSSSSPPPADLNYPSFSVLFDATNYHKTDKLVTRTYVRTLTNVGIPRMTYKLFLLKHPKGVKSLTVFPKLLRFTALGQKLSYKLIVQSSPTAFRPATSTFGSLAWISRKYCVTSPIAVTWQ